MDLKAAFVIASLCALAITSTEAGIPKCCLKTRQKISGPLLMKVEKSLVQLNSGACDISALILYIKGRKTPICVPLKLKTALENARWRMKRNQMKTTP